MNQYNLLVAELSVRIKAAWSGVTIAYGRKLTPFTTMPRAAVSSPNGVKVTRSGAAARTRKWEFDILASFPISDVRGDSLEPHQYDRIDEFHAQFLPYVENPHDLGTRPPAFAGISNLFEITYFKPVESMLEDTFYAVQIGIAISTEVYS